VSINQSSTTLWLLNIEHRQSIPLTPFGWKVSESNPCWSPDSSSVLFISNRAKGGSSQIWQVSLVNGQPSAPTQISNYPIAVSNLLWSPDGSHLAFSAQVYAGMSMQQTLEYDEMIGSIPTRAYTYEKLMVRYVRTSGWLVGAPGSHDDDAAVVHKTLEQVVRRSSQPSVPRVGHAQSDHGIVLSRTRA